MTIVAGFNFNGGILICGDTKHVSTTIHHKSKIHTKEHPSGAKSAFALAGRSSVARMAINECENAISRLSSPTLQEMEDEIVDVLIQIHKKHIFDHPRRGYSDGPDFNLIVGLWSPHDGVKLYITEETALDHVPTFHCWGTGEYLGRYIIQPRYEGPHVPLRSAIFTAVTALSRIKSFDPDCGGKSHFLVLRHDGQMTNESEFDISQNEKFSETFFSYATSLYTLMADSPISDSDIRTHITLFLENMNQARGNLKTEKDRREALIRALSTPHVQGKEKVAGE